MFFSNARLIRLPFDIRNKRYIKIGDHFTTGFGCRIEAFPLNKKNGICLTIGKNVEINDYVHIAAVQSVHIGDNVLMASKIYISDCLHGSYSGNENDDHPNTPPNDRKFSAKSIIINDNVWLGEFVTVLPGVTIGKGTIVGANSVVAKSLPDYVVAVGIPAKPIKSFNFESQRWEKYIS
ncbi:acetyltransferase [Polaribacter litorisediminis]|uniref:acetyltransferase n=1 Tax=Polaribacter litorisediminis TaxID=1908341 RepID=UPI001CBB1D74|nr:acetyltransferase [Polaribacter litorisediminis]